MMNKWITIVIWIVLVAGVGVFGFLYFQESGNLKDAEAEIVTHLDTISGLETDLSASEAEATDLSSKLNASELKVTTLEGEVSDLTAEKTKLDSDLSAANSQISGLQSSLSAAQSASSALTAELKKIKDPRHFSSVTELTDWLQQDDTNTRYASLRASERAFIRQVRALRDGFILPAVEYFSSSNSMFYFYNMAIIEGTIYWISTSSDTLYNEGSFQPLPSHPEPLP